MRSWILFPVLLAAGCAAPTPPFDEAAALERGHEIATATFQALSGRLQQAMQEGGPVYAVDYCSVAALPIADSLSALYGARIKRTSDRIRAPHDQPDEHEREQLNEVLLAMAQGVRPFEIGAQVFILNDSVAYYQPIHINAPTCLKCHGTPGMELDSAAHALIRQRYPMDQAIGYREGDFRGLWSIRWPL